MPQPPKATLQQTLFAAASGDAPSWRLLVETYTPRLFGLLRAHCGDVELAEEISQSTFCTIAEKLRDYVELGRFESWLFRIAMNRLRDEMRRRKRQAVAMEDEALAGLAGAVPEDRPDRADERDLCLLREAMSLLPEADREIIHLRHYGEMSFRQIADLLGQPLGTVLARQHRALRKLGDLIESMRKEAAVKTPPFASEKVQ